MRVWDVVSTCDSLQVSPETIHHAKFAAELLSIEEGKLQRALTNHTITTRMDKTVSPLTKAKADDSRKGACHPRCSFHVPVMYVRVANSASAALAKNVYGSLFNWLVKRLNRTMEPKDLGKPSTASGGAGGSSVRSLASLTIMHPYFV